MLHYNAAAVLLATFSAFLWTVSGHNVPEPLDLIDHNNIRWSSVLAESLDASGQLTLADSLPLRSNGLQQVPTITVDLNTTTATDGGFISVRLSGLSSLRSYGWAWLGLYPAAAYVTSTKPFKVANVTSVCSQPGKTGSDGVCTLVLQVYAVRTSLRVLVMVNGTAWPVVAGASLPLLWTDAVAPTHPRLLPGPAVGEYSVVWTIGNVNVTDPAILVGLTPTVQSTRVDAFRTARVLRESLCGAPANESGWVDLGTTASVVINPQLAADLGLYPAGGSLYYRLTDRNGRLFPAPDQPALMLTLPPWPTPQPQYPFRFIGFGDLGRGSFDDAVSYAEYPLGSANVQWVDYSGPAKDTAALLAEEIRKGRQGSAGQLPLAFVHHWGDISYASGFLQAWDEYLWQTSQYASSVPLVIGIGNHEATWPAAQGGATWTGYGPATDSGGECNMVVTDLLPLPSLASSVTPWYSYASGPVTVLVLSSEHDFSVGSVQYRWLAMQLAEVNRTVTPWLVASLHRPMYINSNYSAGPTSDTAVMSDLQTSLEPLLHAAKVDLLLYGHNHRWERISAALGGQVVQRSTLATVALPAFAVGPGEPIESGAGAGQGLREQQASTLTQVHLYNQPGAAVHYVAGAAGAGYTVNDCWSGGADSSSPTTPPPVFPCPPWSEAVGYAHGYMRFTVLNETALYWEYVQTDGYGQGASSGGPLGAVLDRVLLLRSTSPAFPSPSPSPRPPAPAQPKPATALSPSGIAGVSVAVFAVVGVAAVLYRMRVSRGVGLSGGNATSSSSVGSPRGGSSDMLLMAMGHTGAAGTVGGARWAPKGGVGEVVGNPAHSSAAVAVVVDGTHGGSSKVGKARADRVESMAETVPLTSTSRGSTSSPTTAS